MVQISRNNRRQSSGSGGGGAFVQLADVIAYYLSLCIVTSIIGLIVLYVYLDRKGQLFDRQEHGLKGSANFANTLDVITNKNSPSDINSSIKQGLLDSNNNNNIMSPSTNHRDNNNNGDHESTVIDTTSLITHDKIHLVYGTAWKQDDTARLVELAIQHGFRFVDTACQPKHYNERLVGEGWTKAAKALGLKRSDLYIQTKYTSVNGQDPNRIPYNEHLSITEQVKESLEVSLSNLQTSYLDALVMHSPFPHMKDTLEAYETMETFVDQGKVRLLGISNIYDYQKLVHIYENVRIKPSIIQNRFYSDSNFDKEIRQFCQQHNMIYQSFWTLSANRHALGTSHIRQLATSKGLTPQTLMYAYMMQLNGGSHVTPLDGTTNEQHMKEDIALQNRIRNGETILTNEEMNLMSRILGVSD